MSRTASDKPAPTRVLHTSDPQTILFGRITVSLGSADRTGIRQAGTHHRFPRIFSSRVHAMVNKSSPFDDPPSEKSIAEQWRREFSEELRAFAEPAVGRRLPKSLSDIKSEYDRLCKNHGGPAEIEGFGRVNFEWSCDKYRLGRFDHLLKRWQPDPATGVRHCTPIDHPGPRWSGYVHKLRKAGIVI